MKCPGASSSTARISKARPPSGTGQPAAHFASALPGWTWQPSDRTDAGFAAIRGWTEQTGAANVLPPRRLDVLDADWPSDGAPFASGAFDLVYVANLLHISPWPSCAALMRGAARHLAPGGALAIYIVAKLAELNDHTIAAQLDPLTGHTLKHLLAVAAALLIVARLRARVALRPVPAPRPAFNPAA